MSVREKNVRRFKLIAALLVVFIIAAALSGCGAGGGGGIGGGGDIAPQPNTPDDTGGNPGTDTPAPTDPTGGSTDNPDDNGAVPDQPTNPDDGNEPIPQPTETPDNDGPATPTPAPSPDNPSTPTPVPQPTTPPPNNGGTPTPTPQPTNPPGGSPANSPNTWTFLVYMSSDNSLQTFDYYDMKELEKVGSTSNVNIVVQWDRTRADQYANFSGARRYYVRKANPASSAIQSQMLQQLGAMDMASPDALADFVTWGIKNYPADRYAVILWGHGSGWQDAWRGDIKGISYDEGSHSVLSQTELRQAFDKVKAATGKKIELLGNDACLMGNIEVAYDMRNHANYMTFSEASEPGNGWPYDKVLAGLVSNPGMNGATLGTLIVNSYKQNYSSTSSTTLSTINLSKIAAVKSAVNSLTMNTMATSAAESTRLFNSVKLAQKVDSTYTDYHDLGDFARIAQQQLQSSTLKTNARTVATTLSQAVVAEYHNSSVPYSSGLTIWAPDIPRYNNNYTTYKTLLFAIDTQWDEFLEWGLSQ